MIFTEQAGIFTPYSSVIPLISGEQDPIWAPETERERVASYQKYEEIYWNAPIAFKVWNREDLTDPIYIPNARTVCDATAHFFMKGLELVPESEDQKKDFEAFLKREAFYSTFSEAKASGVVRGDYVFHMVADPTKPAGKRISLKTLDPGSWFPITDPYDPDKILGVDIIDQLKVPNKDNPTLFDVVVRRQRYNYVFDEAAGTRKVQSSLVTLNPNSWWVEGKQEIESTEQAPFMLPDGIDTIPVYSFKNIGWQGRPYGTSELAGFERLMASVNQSAMDEDLSLALEGLGVYATTAPAPDNNGGVWTVAPGYVAEIPLGSEFKRVEGVGSVKPFQDHIDYLEGSLYEASSTFRAGSVDIAVAQSGIALAIKFMPTAAKLDRRESDATDVIQQMFFDWGTWMGIFEKNTKFKEFEVQVKLGAKLPEDPVQTLNELNNMMDRKVITAQYYRQVMTEKFAYVFPDDMDEQLQKEAEAAIELQRKQFEATNDGTQGASDQSGTKNRPGQGAPARKDNSRNGGRRNESSGTEAK